MTDETHLEDLRLEVRSWLDSNAPKGWRESYKAMSHAEFAQAQRDWFQTLVKGGYAVPHWPAEWPGGGRSLAEQKLADVELRLRDLRALQRQLRLIIHSCRTAGGTPVRCPMIDTLGRNESH